ncbi:MAG: recombinase zinc ribbon domain-containing protein, partial [Minisyncoccota bacterium]
LISKELFEDVQKQLKRDSIVRQSHEFAFTKLISCGMCGSTFSAEEKYKQLKDGTVAKYIYYGCGRARDIHCKNHYLREEELVDQIIKALDQIDFNQLGIQHKFEEELRRFNKFQRGVLGFSNSKTPHEEVDLKTYVKYTLKEGTGAEKRELMGCFKSKLKITKGIVTIEQ